MDATGLKTSVARVLVESMFRRAGYRTTRRGPARETGRPRAHDLYVWKPVDADDGFPALHRLARVAVEYREDVERALLREPLPAADGGDVYRVFVTDKPAPGRACFQVVPPADAEVLPRSTVDLDRAEDLDVLPRAVAEYDALVRMTFPVMSGDRASEPRARARRGASGTPAAV